ncbi:MAG: transcription-repair coupling factor [Bacteroidetes bacterium]|nr:transcription-repair coupling factor [Bacteroidota bacterium]
MIETLKRRVYSSTLVRTLIERVLTQAHENPLVISGVHGSLRAVLATAVYENCSVPTILVTADQRTAEVLRDDCRTILHTNSVQFFPSILHTSTLHLDMTYHISRVESLRALSKDEPILMVASASALASPVPQRENFFSKVIELQVNTECPFQSFINQLIENGFVKKDFVEEYGDFAVRGGIIDVYPFIGENPVRIEFWGDTIESIREFEVISQRSIRECMKATIIANIEQENKRSMIFEYFPSNAIIIIDEPELCKREVDDFVTEWSTNTFTWELIEQELSQHRRILHTSFEAHTKSAIHFNTLPHPAVNASVKTTLAHIRRYNEQGYDVLLLCDTQEEAVRLQDLIEEEITSPDGNKDSHEDMLVHYTIVPEALHGGFIFPDARCAVLTEHEIFGRLKRLGTVRRKRFRGFSQKDLTQLRRGDYVVHQDYGVGKFAGLRKLTINGVETEVMTILYDGNDTLYVNLNFIGRVQKYTSQDGHIPKLSKLGTPDWDRLKARARKKIQDIARELIQLYAKRKHEQGFAFAPDTHWQKELEASFMYEDTPDQARATEEVKRDMEDTAPMDRLICGDVGFGKTEIAVRAAFKAVMNSKQVAVLVPTTILAQQHYNTFRDRLDRYSVRIELLSRFKTKKEQDTIVAALRNGTVDIVIGTHRLLSNDVAFKDLGLLIIDEEHRFGVAAKEKLRRLKATVDTLTLTATPIPRTLQFSLLGARDLSLITTPPKNRLPIHTEIAQFDKQLIKEAILRELHRGGQVYVVHDRVGDIEQMKVMLEELVPTARITIAHGQMKGHELERTMMEFLEKRYDVLLCTKIIESGIDIPNVNTIIVNRADRFGMAELYQLRGRVGRSNIQAYAYLLTPPFSTLPRATLRKLQALEEFTELGSGFNLAMRDLEIRGAGNLLGAEQSGFIAEMGFELYQRIVDEAIQELRQQEFPEMFPDKFHQKHKQPETIIEVDIEAYIPDFYVEHDGERFDIYRRLYQAASAEELQALRGELRDRFGEYPEEVEHLFRVVECRWVAASLRISKVELRGNKVIMSFPPSEETSFYEGEHSPFQRIMGVVTSIPQYQCLLKQSGTNLQLLATLPSKFSNSERLQELFNFLRCFHSEIEGGKQEGVQ